jgi:hypothetical protein
MVPQRLPRTFSRDLRSPIAVSICPENAPVPLPTYFDLSQIIEATWMGRLDPRFVISCISKKSRSTCSYNIIYRRNPTYVGIPIRSVLVHVDSYGGGRLHKR